MAATLAYPGAKVSAIAINANQGNSMRAAVFKETGKPLAIENVANPECGPTDLILKVKNCGICGSDLHMTESTSAMPLALGSIMGHEFAGEVIEVRSEERSCRERV